jgi:hypothetical protein
MVLFLLPILHPVLFAQDSTKTLEGFWGIKFGSSLAEAKNIILSKEGAKLDTKNSKQDTLIVDGAKSKTVLTDEKKLLLNSSYFGNYINAKKQKLSKPRKAKLNVWEPYYTYMSICP